MILGGNRIPVQVFHKNAGMVGNSKHANKIVRSISWFSNIIYLHLNFDSFLHPHWCVHITFEKSIFDAANVFEPAKKRKQSICQQIDDPTNSLHYKKFPTDCWQHSLLLRHIKHRTWHIKHRTWHDTHASRLIRYSHTKVSFLEKNFIAQVY